MLFEWDKQKRLSNLAKQGFDFTDAIHVFGSDHALLPSTHTAEPRMRAIGKVGGLFVTVVFTMRGERYRIISMRRSRGSERFEYQSLYGG